MIFLEYCFGSTYDISIKCHNVSNGEVFTLASIEFDSTKGWKNCIDLFRDMELLAGKIPDSPQPLEANDVRRSSKNLARNLTPFDRVVKKVKFEDEANQVVQLNQLASICSSQLINLEKARESVRGEKNLRKSVSYRLFPGYYQLSQRRGCL